MINKTFFANDVSVVENRRANAILGDTVTYSFILCQGRIPLELSPDTTVKTFWRSKNHPEWLTDEGENTTLNGNIVSFQWDPSFAYDGPGEYEFYIEIYDNSRSYRANATIRLQDGPYEGRIIPVDPYYLDYANITVANASAAPWALASAVPEILEFGHGLTVADNVVSVTNYDSLSGHIVDTDLHLAEGEKALIVQIPNKANTVDLLEHINNTTAHVTTAQTAKWDNVDLKANADEVYTKVDTDIKLAQKAFASAVYTKAETESAIDAKVPVISEGNGIEEKADGWAVQDYAQIVTHSNHGETAYEEVCISPRITCDSPEITLQKRARVYLYTPQEGDEITIDGTYIRSDDIFTFELWLTVEENVNFTIDDSVIWLNPPDISEAGIYYISMRRFDGMVLANQYFHIAG